MKRMKRFLAMLLVVATICTTGILTTGASAAESRETKAQVLSALGLFKGYDDTGTNFGLSNGATREHAILFLIRMLGEESVASTWSGPQPFSDVPQGNYYYSYIGYAKDQGYTNGLGNNKFGLGQSANMKQMTAFALRGLGYSETAGDFTYQNSLVFAKSKGILESSTAPSSFTRGNAVDVIYGATFSNMKNQSVSLVEKLAANGAVTDAQLTKANDILEGKTTVKSDLAEGTYTMKCLGNYVRVTSGKAELRDTSPAQVFTVVSKDGYSYIKAEDGKYLALASGYKDGTQLITSTSAFPWIIQKQSSGAYTIRPKAKTTLVVNATEGKSANGTKVIVWTHSSAPSNTLITFTAAGPKVAVTGVKLDQTSVSVGVGKTTQLTGTISPTNATNQNVTWSSSASTVAKVDSNGLVTGVKVGTATITVKTADGSKTDTCKVTVSNSTVAVTGVKLDQTTASVGVGKTTQLTGTISPTNATNKNVTWSSSASTVAKVDSNGLVTGVKAGTATITVKTADGSKTATCKVTVTATDGYTDKLVHLYNSTTQAATDIRISSTKNNSWGSNLTSGSVAANANVDILVPVSSTDYTYDIAIIYKDGSTVTFAGYNFKDFTSGGSLYAYLDKGTPVLSTTKPGSTNAYTNKTVKLYNFTNQAVTDVRISSNLNTDWGEKLNSGSVASGGSVSIIVPVAANDSKYDIKLTYSGGTEVIFTGYDFKNFTSGSALYAYIENDKPMLSTTKPTATEDTAAESKTLRDRYNTSVARYNKLIDQLSKMQVESGSVIDQVTKNMTDAYNAIGSDLGSGTGNYTAAQIAEHNKSLAALESLMNDLDAAIKEAQKPTPVSINVTFANATNADFNNFVVSKGGAGTSPATLKSAENSTYSFTVTSSSDVFNVSFTEGITNTPYTLDFSFDKSFNDGDRVTVTLNAENGKVTYSLT